MVTRLVKVVAALAIGALALVACSTTPGTAATVNGRTITEAQVSQASAEMSEVLGLQVDRQQMLSRLVSTPTVAAVAQQHGIAASDTESAEVLARQAESVGAAVPEDGFSAPTLVIAQSLILEQMVQAAPNAEQIANQIETGRAEMDVQLSPRYGQWDAETGPVPAPPEWIHQSATPVEPAENTGG